VGADDARQARASAERRDVVRDIGGAAQARVLGLEMHDRDRGFGGDARHAADDEAIEHDVAAHEHGLSIESRDDLLGARGFEARSATGHAVAARAAAAGSVTTIRNSIRTSESPKVYSNMQAVRSAGAEAG